MDHAAALREAAKVAEIARSNAVESEHSRRMAAPVAAAMDASGLNKLMLPTALGGISTHPVTLVEVIETIAVGDASAAWCAGIGMGTNATSSVVDETVAKEVFADPMRSGVGVFSPTGRLTPDGDRLQLEGRWPFASNCHQAAAACVGVLRIGPDGKPARAPGSRLMELAFVPATDFVIEETWDMSGMRGTGSHDIVVAGASVSEQQIADLFGPKWPTDALFRLRMFDILVPCLAGVPLGIGRAALDAVLAHVAERGDEPQRGPRMPFGLDPTMQLEVGQAEIRLRGARALLLDLLDEAYGHAFRGDAPPRELSALVGLASLDTLAVASHAVDTAVRALGTSASREGSLLDRLRRDIVSAGGHVLFAPSNAATLGRQAAGMRTVALPFLPPD